ncbi:YncE family protein [Flavobacterium sp. IMCC34852]|uniref:YncE family protein n=2 Tax=Flavobacterium TaxID=237 RepID=A0A7Y3VYN5_9FLAO|nr:MULTISPECIES: YncE family protein [Flavobacterium]NNT71596.1 YncE family protein [Flavobacterium sp. IMCC34852]SHF64230.1 40-residue YVTN family beta-propeller repeat-containing protein [Flavobacterium fontis]
MKNLSMIASFIGALFLTSCNNNDDNMDMTLNVDYPAAYIVNGEDGSVSVVKLSTNEVTGTIELMGSGSDMIMWPHHISSHQDHLAIGVPGMDLSAGHSGLNTSGMNGKLLVIDAMDGSIIKNINLPLMNHNSIYSPNGNEIWVPQMDEMNSKVLVYDATTNALLNTIDVGMMAAELTFSSDGTKAYVANGDDDNVTVINTSTKAIITTIAVGDNPVGAWTGSNNKMYVDNEDGQTISVIDVATNSVDETITLGFMPGIASYNGPKNELWVSDPMAGKVHYWTWDAGMNMWMHGSSFNTGAGAHAIAFTTDGNTAYVTNQTANTVSVVNTTNHSVTKTINVGRKPNGIVIKM